MVKGSSAPIEPEDDKKWTFSISLDINEQQSFSLGSQVSTVSGPATSKSHSDENVPESLLSAFHRDGFVVFRDPVLSREACDALNQRLEEILRGRYSTGRAPDKAPRRLKSEYEGSPHIVQQRRYYEVSAEERQKMKKPLPQSIVGAIGFSGNVDNVKVIQVINVHKADSLFRKLVCSEQLGKVVAQLAGWKSGARLAQDQIWAKPPASAPLAFHRDSPYFMFHPDDVVTVWLALDDMDEEVGPLQYVKGSHLWGEGRVGVATQFFQSNGGISLLKSAADRHQASVQAEHVSLDNLEIVSMAGLQMGALSIHNGRTWHGSGKNNSQTRPRRGLGLHFVPAEVRFTAEAYHSRLWRPYVEDVLARGDDPSTVELPLEDFPITWQPTSDSDNGNNCQVEGS